MLVPILKGVSTYIPGFNIHKIKNLSATPALYYYGVWLRHLIIAHNNGLSAMPNVVAELGPGGSLGAGLAALLSGVSQYYALDIVQHVNLQKSLEILEDLVILFRRRTPIPTTNDFAALKPSLDRYEFPSHILNDSILNMSLESARIDRIRNMLSGSTNAHNQDSSGISYYVPWNDHGVIQENSVDMLFSQAVLEHVDNLDHAYKACYSWLKPGAVMSHQIDFKSHGTAKEWNGHWMYDDFVWKLIRGKRKYLINREPLSTHLKLLKQYDFELILNNKVQQPTKFVRGQLASEFSNFTDEDLTTSAAFLLALKK